MVNLFAESVEIVFRDIHGNPIFDIYNDEDQIQDEDKLDDRESNNQSDEVHYQQIGFLLTDDEMEGGCDGEVVGDGRELNQSAMVTPPRDYRLTYQNLNGFAWISLLKIQRFKSEGKLLDL
ncbi:hypothetical protein YC2023_095062 [Brassica napus]